MLTLELYSWVHFWNITMLVFFRFFFALFFIFDFYKKKLSEYWYLYYHPPTIIDIFYSQWDFIRDLKWRFIDFHPLIILYSRLFFFFQTGWVWSNLKTTFNQWSIECVFKVTGRGRVGADGLVNLIDLLIN